jgi:isopenicillin N synthase-like dioxygenase
MQHKERPLFSVPERVFACGIGQFAVPRSARMPSTLELKQSDPLVGLAPGPELCMDARQLAHEDSVQREVLVDRVRKACLGTGFFYVDNAFAGDPVAANALAQMQRFFSLPDNDPRKIAVDNRRKQGSYGWMPMFGEPAYQPGTRAHVESFDCGLGGNANSIKALEGSNVWPDLPGFRDDIGALWDRLVALAGSVLEVLAEAANLERDFLSSRCNTQEHSTLRLLHYPGGHSEDRLRDVGIAAHTDFECISLILQTGPGLELTDIHGQWYEAPAHPDRVIVLLDDMLERWTNGYFQATGHRVRRTAVSRYSIVLFVAVNANQVIRPLEPFVNAANPARFDAVTQRQHIDAEVRRSEAYRAESLAAQR